jgi:hypothetical protein
MDISLSDLHDATLLSLHFDWKSRTCHVEFEGAPGHPAPFTFIFTDVQELMVPASLPWGPSVSVLEATELPDGGVVLEMQSGDRISVVSPNHSFKRTPDGAA